MHDNTLTQDNRNKFIYIAGQYKQTVKFYNVEENYADKVAEFKKMLPVLNTTGARTVGTLFKFFIARVLPNNISKVIYFDSDIIINSDVDKLWQIKLNSVPLAAVPEVESHVDTRIHTLVRKNIVATENYFNAGMFIMNLDRIRNEESLIIEGIKFRIENTDCDCTDQDIWNYCFSEDYLKLPAKFNTLVEYARMHNDFNVENKICHYTTSAHGQGFGLDMSDSYNRLWLKYFAKTPWFNEEVLGRMYEGIQQIYAEQKNLLVSLSAIMSGKTRAFFLLPDSIEMMKKVFQIKPNEEIIPAPGPESLKNLAESMKKSGGKKLYILVLPMYSYCYKFLTQAGFVEGKDFINGFMFLSDAQGVPLNPYRIIKLM